MNSTLNTLSQSEINSVKGGYQIISMPSNPFGFPTSQPIGLGAFLLQRKVLSDFMHKY